MASLIWVLQPPVRARPPTCAPTCRARELDQDVEVISAAPSLSPFPPLQPPRSTAFLAFLRSSEVAGFSFLLLVMRTRSSTVTESAASACSPTENCPCRWKSASLAWSTQRFPREGARGKFTQTHLNHFINTIFACLDCQVSISLKKFVRHNFKWCFTHQLCPKVPIHPLGPGRMRVLIHNQTRRPEAGQTERGERGRPERSLTMEGGRMCKQSEVTSLCWPARPFVCSMLVHPSARPPIQPTIDASIDRSK